MDMENKNNGSPLLKQEKRQEEEEVFGEDFEDENLDFCDYGGENADDDEFDHKSAPCVQIVTGVKACLVYFRDIE